MTCLVIFAGGSGCRAITIELARLGCDVTRIAPAWDSGGSSRIIRDALHILSVGDIRNALMALAHGEGRAGNVVKVFNTRLSDAEDRAALQRELAFYMDGVHPALRAMDEGLRQPIIGYLRKFSSVVGADFDLRRGSLGNFVLAGAYLAHGRDINTAISVFRELCSIRGNVWPTSTANDLHLQAELKDGESVRGQDRITSLDKARARVGIRSVSLVGAAAQANERVLEAISAADAIVFGPGSFYTSVVPHVLVSGIGRAIAARKGTPKIFVGNMLECPETVGLSVDRMVGEFVEYSRTHASRDDPANAFVTHVLANQTSTPFQRSVGGRGYVPFDERDPTMRQWGIETISQDFEDPWQRGIHEPSLVASAIARLSSKL